MTATKTAATAAKKAPTRGATAPAAGSAASTQTPSVGRIVHYHTTADQTNPIAAMITAVQGDKVELMIFYPGRRTPGAEEQVKHDSVANADEHRWSWPPIK